MIAKQPQSRALAAALLLVALLAALLGAWFLSGWHDVRRQQSDARIAPATAASARTAELARELRTELDALLSREVRRPYFHYQNLMHDPRSSVGVGVTPSPLAKTPDDRFILGYFQIDGAGRATTPTINEELPELSDPENIAVNRAFRDQLVRDLARSLRPEQSVLVAQADPPPMQLPSAPPRPRPQPQPQPQRPDPPPQQVQSQQMQQQQAIQSIRIDNSSYQQNRASNRVYWEQQTNNVTPDVASLETDPQVPQTPIAQTQTQTQTQQTQTTQQRKPPTPTPTPTRKTVEPDAPIMITVSPFEWRTLTFAGAPALLAVRQVQTPDETLAQGFVVDRATLTSWLASKTEDMVGELHSLANDATPPPHAAEVAPGWHLTVAPNPRTLTTAAANAVDIARTFIVRFVVVGVIAALAAALVLLLVLRAEKLARERSQFAAAAAHELRTPLAGLQLYGDMLADGLGDPGKLKDYARRMSEEAARLGRVVSNVLGFSQLERGNLSVDPKPDTLDEALRDLAERAQPALDRAGAALELDVTPDLRARFDRDALARIVGNLLDNAEKYARTAEDRTILLAARERGSKIEIVVADRGPGIADKTPLFRAFSRGVPSDGPAGLGLGLALSRSLAQAMGGELSYRARDGGGAELVLELPRA